MIPPTKDPQKVRIYITTFEKKKIMATKKPRDSANKFICSICLNTNAGESDKKADDRKRKTLDSKSCHVCHTGKNCITGNKVKHDDDFEDKNVDSAAKDVQTSETNITQGLNLLNEVLTVFQRNKENKDNTSKTSILKDIGTLTDENRLVKPKLTITKVVSYCIGEFDKLNVSNNCTIIDYHQPDVIKINHNSLDLIRHKSSSIPQMKLEELKHSIREKTKSKDAIEEVNRMFATVRKREYNLDDDDDSNRPLTRIGPRVLPVVKTEMAKIDSERKVDTVCKCCQTHFHLSSGDSTSQCCQKVEETYEQTVCCRYKKHRNRRKETVICECCKCVRNQH